MQPGGVTIVGPFEGEIMTAASARLAAASLALAFPAAAAAQDAPPPDASAETQRVTVPTDGPIEEEGSRRWRYRVTLGPRVGGGFPGNDRMQLLPFFGLSRARGDEPYRFGGVGEGASIPLLRGKQVEVGPMFRFEGRRDRDDIGGGVNRVGRTVELGGFAQYWPRETIRLRADVRKGIGGHKGWVGSLAADRVWRDGDRWLVSLGPRAVISDGRRHNAFFGVDEATSLRTGLPRFDAKGGVESLGAQSRVVYAFDERWGVQGFVTYARLIGDAGSSPLIRRVDSQDQVTAGLGLTYTFSR